MERKNRGLTLIECLCLCNPCWCEDSDDYLFVTEEEEEQDTDGPFLFQEGELSHGIGRKKEEEEEEDVLILPMNYDPMREYYDAFHTLGEKITNHVPSQIQFEGIVRDLKRAEGRGFLSLNSHLIYYGVYICSLPVSHQDRYFLIKDYEIYMNIFVDIVINTDEESAKTNLKYARSHKNRKVDRLLAYERAIYYTHNTENKRVVINEYCQFCDSLKSHSLVLGE